MAEMAKLVLQGADGKEYALNKQNITIGSSPHNDIVLTDPRIATFHARIRGRDGRYELQDLGSAAGTLVNGERLSQEPRVLRDGDRIATGGVLFVFKGGSGAGAVASMRSDVPSVPPAVATPGAPRLWVRQNGGWSEVALNKDVVTIGRTSDNDLVIASPMVSRRHAEVRRRDGAWEIVDLGGSNGTLFNGLRITQKILAEGDEVSIGGQVTVVYSLRPVPPGAAAPAPVAPARAAIGAPPVPPPAAYPAAPGIAGPPAQHALAGPAAPPAPAGARPVAPPDYPPAPPGQGAPPYGGALPAIGPRLWVQQQEGWTEVPLTRDIVSIGRTGDNDIVIESMMVSRHHAQVRRRGANWEFIDLESHNGTYFQQQRFHQKTLNEGDIISIGGQANIVFTSSLTLPGRAASAAPAPAAGSPTPEPVPPFAMPPAGGGTAFMPVGAVPEVSAPLTLQLQGRDVITLGRYGDNDVALDSPQVSRHHARIERTAQGYLLRDLGSTNHTFVNGQAVSAQLLRNGDEIRIGPYRFVLGDGGLVQYSEEGNIKLEALHITKDVDGGKKRILNDISLVIEPREFVALVGVSGAGKSTLLDALNGFRPATSGAVLVNSVDLYQNFDSFRTSFGYVPQDDIIHRELTVEQALDYAGKLRLPKDMDGKERKERVNQVLRELGLEERRSVPVHRLSGGQRKRVSIGVELLTRPSLFYLDEPTSGLDPGTETRMMGLLRQLADQGRTIILITHATKNISMCDKVIFLTKGGRLAYYGSPADALQYFQVGEFTDIYDTLENQDDPSYIAPEEAEQNFRRSPLYKQNIVDRLSQQGFNAVHAEAANARLISSKKPRRSAFSQFYTLTHRYVRILFTNKANVALLVFQAPLVALFMLIVFKADLFSTNPDVGDASLAMTVLFLLACGAIFTGANNAVKEIVKEDAIYRRERAVNLKILPYLFSKIIVLGALGLIQAFLATIALWLGHIIPTELDVVVKLFITYYLTISGGMMMGLIISAFVRSTDVATSMVPLLLMPQFMFSGALLPIKDMGILARIVSVFMIAKWAFEAMGASTDIIGRAKELCNEATSPQAPGQVFCQNANQAQQLGLIQKFSETFDVNLVLWWIILAGFAVLFTIGMFFALRLKDRK
jgi:pSer/pThr/pTyr-binding forkhead associated (FHA) protein/ABC-type multidrug transport system ATPase subunit